jgi:PAS domain S-box-containing protein
VSDNNHAFNHLSLKDLQQRYFRLLEAMSEGVYGLDADGLATFVNPAAERITGWSFKRTKRHYREFYKNRNSNT